MVPKISGKGHLSAVTRLLSVLAFSITLTAANPPDNTVVGTDSVLVEKEELLEMEKAARFNDALGLIDRSAQKPSYSNHQEKLKAFARDFPVVDQALKKKHFKEAEEILKKDSDKVDSLQDLGLFEAAQTKLGEVHGAMQKALQGEVNALIQRAHQMEKRSKYAEAAKLYDEALAMDANKLEAPLPSALRAEVQTEKLAAEEMKTKSEASFWTLFWKSVSAGLTTLATWTICLVAALLLCGGAFYAKRLLPREKGARIAIDDMTGPASDRDARSKDLTRDMAIRLSGFGSGPEQSTELDDTPDLDSGNLMNLVIHHDSQAAQLPLANTAASVGPFSINPAQLLALLQQLTARRSEHSFRGTLVSQGSRQVLLLECSSIDPALNKKRWQSSADGVDAGKVREEVLTEASERVAFELLKPRSTNSFVSFYSYRSGRVLMSSARTAENRAEILGNAAARFRDCIQADPGNWMGWFYLATVLRKRGQNKHAANHFQLLQELLKQPGQLLTDFLARQLYFSTVVDYNYAVCLSKLDDWKMHQKSVTILKKLIESLAAPVKPVSATKQNV